MFSLSSRGARGDFLFSHRADVANDINNDIAHTEDDVAGRHMALVFKGPMGLFLGATWHHS